MFMPDVKYPHADHRKRMRAAFLKTDIDSVPDRSMLEMLLFYAVPRKDTAPIADRLMEKYGSVKNVLDAPYEELKNIEGMGESSALMMSILSALGRRLSAGGEARPVKGNEETVDAIEKKLRNAPNEIFTVICCDAFGRVIAFREVGEGSPSEVAVDKRKILETAFEFDADSVILVHNHPGGDAAPSKADITLTREAAALLAQTGIKLTDHIIVGKDSRLSLASTANFSSLFD